MPGINDMHRYDDIIDLPHPTSLKHPRMSTENRAAQFSPFAALTGYDDAVSETARLTQSRGELDEQGKALLDERLRLLRENIAEQPEVDIIYFRPDLRKFGGEYVPHSGALRCIDPVERSLLFADGFRVAIDDIYHLDSDIFRKLKGS